jgi:hypothetical protein
MRKTLPLVGLLAVTILLAFYFYPSKESFKEVGEDPSEEATEVDKLIEQEFRLTRDPKLNRIPRERLLVATEARNAKLSTMKVNTAVSGIAWTERGPNNVGGRTRALWFDLNGAPGYTKVWSGGVAGGLWVTNDITVATPVWTKKDDFFDNLAISSFVQSPTTPNTMYFGTGEGWFNSDAVQGLGIWKSTDGGNTWGRLMSTANFLFVQDLLIDNNGNLYATLRPTGTSAGGVQKSTDGGNTWTQVLGSPVFGSSARGADLEMAPNGDIYCSLGTTGSNGGIYVSSAAVNGVNTGNAGTWVNITPNAAGTIMNPTSFWNRIELATAPSNPDVVYALFQGFNNSNCTSIQQYTPSTNTWTVRSVPTIIDQGSNSVFTRGQAFYDLIAAVDPNNANSLYIGGVDALRSDDNGATWTQMSTWSLFAATGFTAAQNIHADHHAITYVPGSSSRVLWGTDGGVYYTTDANITGVGAKPTWAGKNTGYNVTQYYGCAIHPTTTNYFLAGAQDNGSHRFNAAGLNNVTSASGGDGGFPHIDQDNGNVQITSYVNNNYFISTNNGVNFTTFNKNNRGDFINPTDYDNTANILYGGDDPGFYYRWTSPESNGADAQVGVTAFGTGFITHVAVSPITLNRVYFGLDNGSVVMVDNAQTGTTQAGVTIKPAAVGVVSCIAIDPADENHMLVTSSNFGVNNVYESTNALSGSPTWTVVDGNLPDMPVRWAMFDPRNSDWALLATELGVWSTDNINGGATDWSPTNSGLANVRVDMLQYRASDRTIAAATHGRGLYTAAVPNVTTPDINFNSSSKAVSELTSATSGCLFYTDYSVPMTIANAPTGDANITVSIQAGNTATQGLDFDFTTNGNFAAPSNTFTFASGSTTPQNITVRVYNDAMIEPAESFTFVYAISGTTNAQPGAGAQSHTFIINNDDQAPLSGVTGNFNVGLYDGNLGNAPIFRANKQRHRIQTLFRASELVAAGITSTTYITSLVTRVVTKNSTVPYTGFTVSLANTSATNLNTGFIAPAFTQVFSADYTTVVGDNPINFTTPFLWDGTSNIVMQFCYDNGAATPAGAADIMEGTLAPFGAGVRPSTYSDWISGGGVGCTLPVQFVSDSRIRAVFGTSGAAVASTLNTSRSEYLGPQSDLFFYSNSGELLARVRNLTSHDYGCTQVVIDRAGTASSQFWNNNTANYLMNKTFRVIPTNNNPAGQFEITLYYSQAEVNGWQTATGQTFNNILLVKIPGQISNVTPGNPEPDGPGTVQVVTPARGTFGSNSTLTYTFTNGFSGFGAGLPAGPLPVRLTEFTGRMQNNSAILDWKTASEQNSKSFEVERSYDGVTFTKIGTVAAAGHSNTVRTYQFADRDIAQETNFYRLKQIDLDGQFVHSKTILLRYEPTGKAVVRILRNPVQNNLDIEFASIPNGKVEVRVVDLNGRTLVSYQNPNVNQRRIRIALEGKLAAQGVYVVNILMNGQHYSQRILKE